MKKRILTIKEHVIELAFRKFALAFLASLLFHFNNYGQVDPKKLDSLSRLIDSSAHVYKKQQDSFIKYHDSAYKSEIDKSLQLNLNNHLTEQKRSEQKGRQQTYVRIILSVLLFMIAIIALMRRRKSKL